LTDSAYGEHLVAEIKPSAWIFWIKQNQGASCTSSSERNGSEFRTGIFHSWRELDINKLFSNHRGYGWMKRWKGRSSNDWLWCQDLRLKLKIRRAKARCQELPSHLLPSGAETEPQIYFISVLFVNSIAQ